MAIYAVGDIQGCYDPLARLLDKVDFEPAKDTLLCVGDLVNRGPKSLKVLRLLKSLEDSCVAVLGNHDIHLMTMAYGIRKPRSGDSLDTILNSSDCDELIYWLRHRPLMVLNMQSRYVLSHAGIYPWWSVKQAKNLAREVEQVLQDDVLCPKLLKRIYGNSPAKWNKNIGYYPRKRFIVNTFTRMRFISPLKQRLNLNESGFNGRIRKNKQPWFSVQNPDFNHYRFIFGHWSALGFYNQGNFLALDSGCVWGKHMTMVKIPKNPTSIKPIKKSNIFISPNYE